MPTATEKMGRSGKGFLIVLCFLFSCDFTQLGSAHLTSCTVTKHNDKTTYTIISDVPLISAVKAFDCEYTWANASDHVMAHNDDKAPELVLTNSINTLITSRCIDKVVYTRSCVSEGEHFTANCITSCFGSAQRDEVFNPHPIALIAIVVVLVVVLVVVGGILVFLFYKCKKKRVPSSGQRGTRYWAV